MTHFMAYVMLLSAGVGACAVVVELLLRSRVSATRWVWLSALVSIAMIALIATFAPSPVDIAPPISPARPLIVDGVTAPSVRIAVDRIEARSIVQMTDAVLPVVWGVASCFLLFAILLGQRRLTIARRSAESRSVNGHHVLLTENLGPAVAGFARPVVFLPRWVLALDHPSQQLLLAHEFEHAKRGDTRLLLAGAVTAAIMPWNPVVWWITRRLRLAVEQDCDARVLRTHPDVRRYADLLLTAASRPGVYASLLAAHFGEHRSDLDRRIQVMTDNSVKWRPMLAVAAVAAGLIVASCEAPRPDPLAPRTAGEKAKPDALSDDGVLHESQVEKPVTLATGSPAPRYPDILRQAGVSGEALVSFIVNEGGTADVASFKVIRSTHELFATTVRKTLPEMRFVPAEVGGRKVKQLVEQPFTFSIVGSTPSSAESSPSAPGSLEQIAITGIPSQKRLAYPIRRNEALSDIPPNVVVYSFDGIKLARGEDLETIDPQSIHSIEVFKPSRCPADLTCPAIKITLARGKTLGSETPGLQSRDHKPWAVTDPVRQRQLDSIMSAPMTIELRTSEGELFARYENRAALYAINLNSEDITRSEAYTKNCRPSAPCPVTRIWLKPGRDAAYRKR